MNRWMLTLLTVATLGCTEAADVAPVAGCVVRPNIAVSHPANNPEAQIELVPPDSNGYRVLGLHHHTSSTVAPHLSLYLRAPDDLGFGHAVILDRDVALPIDALLPPGVVIDVPAHVALIWWARPTDASSAGITVMVCDPL